MVKTITISDDVYNELLRIKGKKSFSELLRELLREKKGNSEALKRICGILNEEEYRETKKRLKELEGEFEKWEQFLTFSFFKPRPSGRGTNNHEQAL
ncbi:antitoxin VapB family protein [Thermococcus sp. PK]|uniref:antitoxin VapB family protein n=1 Tax=Thermococcus sp. PK TaxID=913025 RepID=UPI0009FED68B|nr:antitoxin VapB family protein [Thermococcus sp. PK]